MISTELITTIALGIAIFFVVMRVLGKLQGHVDNYYQANSGGSYNG